LFIGVRNIITQLTDETSITPQHNGKHSKLSLAVSGIRPYPMAIAQLQLKAKSDMLCLLRWQGP